MRKRANGTRYKSSISTTNKQTNKPSSSLAAIPNCNLPQIHRNWVCIQSLSCTFAIMLGKLQMDIPNLCPLLYGPKGHFKSRSFGRIMCSHLSRFMSSSSAMSVFRIKMGKIGEIKFVVTGYEFLFGKISSMSVCRRSRGGS
jgi:hypothetical protein